MCSVATESENSAFLFEALRMKGFDHENVLTLIGIYFNSDGLPMVVMPYMEKGDLLSYLRSELNSPTIRELLTFALQV